MNTVIKRNGNYEAFQGFKIEEAIKKAFHSVGVPYSDIIFQVVIAELTSKPLWEVEEIQDAIERILYEMGYFEVMRSFMVYRHTRKLQRENLQGFDDNSTYVDSTRTVEEYIFQQDWRIQANANNSFSNAGLVNNTAGKIIANYWLDKVYSKVEGYAHRNAEIPHPRFRLFNRLLCGLEPSRIADEGFNGVRGRVDSRPPSHFRRSLRTNGQFLGNPAK